MNDASPTPPAAPPRPPVAPARPEVLRHHGDERVDPWFWLNQRDDPEVVAYLEAENAHTRAAMTPLAPLREHLYRELVGRVQETDASAPTRRGPYEYFVRTVEGEQYDVHCRRPAGTPGLPDPIAAPGVADGETIVLDENALAGDGDYLAVGDLAISPDHSLVAYTVDRTGGERYDLRFRALSEERAPVDDVVPDLYYGLAWADDGVHLLYVRPDEAMRPWQVWRHHLGTPAADDVLVFQEDDEHFFVSVERTRTRRLLVITSASKVTSEVWLLDATEPTGELRLVEAREAGVEYHVEHHVGPGQDRLLVVTNADGAENFALCVAPTATPGRAHWKTVLAASDDVRLDDVDAFADHLVLSERADGLEQLRIVRVADDGSFGIPEPVPTPETVGSIWLGGNPEFDTLTVRFGYTSMATPRSTYDHSTVDGSTTLVKRQPVPGYEPERYETRRLWATASDGTRIPISYVARRDRPEGPGPVLLYGYGSYEVSIEPSFSSARVSLLDRGVGYAIAHIRGGGELGRHWYEDGKLFAKRNTFTDFVAAAEHLVDEGFTAPSLLAARGGSAGGLLMGAVANLRPDLFRAIVAEVPFVDCLTTILDETLPLTVTEWEEWGNPVADPALYEYLKSYSPYDNVAAVPYPALLITGGLNDPRVQYWEPAKWAAKLRATTTGDLPVYLKTEMGAGHSGPSGRYDAWRDEAFVLAFVLDQLGIADTPPS